MKTGLLVLFLSLVSPALMAETILDTIPAKEGVLPTLAQLTPGHTDFLYAPSLLNASFDEKGRFHYALPSQAKSATAQPPQPKGFPSPDGKYTALLEGDRLWLYQTHDSTATRVEISDPTAESDSPHRGQSAVVWGQSVHRNEFGIDGGVFWSPTSDLVAFYRMDQSKVGQYPLVQTDCREAEVKWIHYPMAGCTSHEVTLGVYNPATQQTVYLQTNEKPETAPFTTETQPRSLTGINAPDHYLTRLTWRPDGKQLLVAELNRAQNYMEMNLYEAATGKFLRTLFTERSEKYVEPSIEAYFLPGSNDRFIWCSERDGYLHAYLYSLADMTEGAPLTATRLTEGDYEITELIGADPSARFFYFLATKDSPLERNLYSVNLPQENITATAFTVTRVTKEAGTHHVMCNKQYTEVYDTYTHADTPRRCQLLTLKNGQCTATKVLYNAPSPYAANNEHPALFRPAIEVGTIKAADGKTDLYYRLVKPRFLAGQHPTIVYLYNGPHAQLINDRYEWGAPGWDCYMAARGYVVFTIDGRGSDYRGLDFEQTIWHDLGRHEADDQMQGVAYLKTLPYVDPERIGIYGWSYGGFMTTYMMLHQPETFQVGVAGGPVLDWSRYEVMYGERYMSTPQDNPEGYAANTLIDQTAQLKGHLLLIHDDQDDTVVPQMSMQFLKKAVENHTYPDFLMYINHAHNVRGQDRVHLLQNIARYFDEHL